MKRTVNIKTPDADFLRIGFEIKSLDANGLFTGYAAVWDEIDQVDDVCVKGAFASTLADWVARGTWPRVKWQHFDTIGHVTDLKEDANGLLAAGKIWFPDVVSQIQAAVPSDANPDGPGVGMSFAFVAVEWEIKGGVRFLTRVDLLDDITITLRPVQTSAELLEVKSGDTGMQPGLPYARTLEGSLRDAGCSRHNAKRILAAGYPCQRDAGGEALSALVEINKALKGI